jgi:hypothetical protein
MLLGLRVVNVLVVPLGIIEAEPTHYLPLVEMA